MASSYSTSLGIEKMATGDQSGAWGTTSNHNWDILDRISAYAAVALSDAATATLTVREASPGSGTENLQNGMYRVIKFTGSLSQACTITIAPNTTKMFFIVVNATTDAASSGPYSLAFTQGSGANVTVQNGKNAVIYCDGAGSGAVVTDALSDLQLSTLDASGDITAANFQPDGDTAAADSAAVGYTSAEGLILTGQGSTNDVTIKNDADAAVISIPTGTTNVTIAGDLTISGDDLTMGTNTSGAALIADGTNFNPVVISGDISINTSGVAAIGSGVIVTADIADDAVTLAKMASGVDGVVISYDASGNPTHVGPGSDGEVLTSTGAGSPPAFEAAAGGPSQATQSALEAETNEDTYAPPDLIKYSPGVCKAWASVDRSSGTPSLESPSYNVTSVTDGGSATTTVTIATNFSTSVYSILCIAITTLGAQDGMSISSRAAGSFVVYAFNTGGAARDTTDFMFSAFGDQS